MASVGKFHSALGWLKSLRTLQKKHALDTRFFSNRSHIFLPTGTWPFVCAPASTGDLLSLQLPGALVVTAKLLCASRLMMGVNDTLVSLTLGIVRYSKKKGLQG